MGNSGADHAIRFEPDEPCSPAIALGVGIQGVVLVLAAMVTVVTVSARAGGQSDGYLLWALFASLIIAGVLTALQAGRWWHFGAGHILFMGPSPNYIAVTVLALAAGGPALLGSLAVAAAVFYVVLSVRLPALRRIITPAVAGTVLMLIAATVLPVALNLVNDVPADAPAAAGPVTGLVTLTAVIFLSLRASGRWRIAAPLIAVGCGCAAAALFGIVDAQSVRDVAWIGLPERSFASLDLTPGVEFWALLPAFVVVALVGSVKNVGDFVAVQQVSWRKPTVTDFRLVQGSLNANGLGILCSGLAGTPPTSVYSSSNALLINLTGVASRRVGYAIGGLLVALALLPKLAAVLLAIPSPVMGAYLLSAVGLLFVSGLQTAVSDGLDRGKALTVGIAFSLGLGLDSQTFGADLLGETWGPLIDSGMLAGALVAVLLSFFVELTNRGRRDRLSVDLHLTAVGELDQFLRDFASRIGWEERAAQRLRSAGEEALTSLLQGAGDARSEPERSLVVGVRQSGAVVEMEFLAVVDERNLEDRLAYLDEESQSTAGLAEGEISLRLLQHYASAVRHQKFHGLDVVTVRVTAAG